LGANTFQNVAKPKAAEPTNSVVPFIVNVEPANVKIALKHKENIRHSMTIFNQILTQSGDQREQAIGQIIGFLNQTRKVYVFREY
jgi:hypothetical protein